MTLLQTSVIAAWALCAAALAAYAAAHFSVDLCCAWSMLRAGAATGKTVMILIFYHLLAFGLQAFFGMFLDRKPGFYQNAALLGCAGVTEAEFLESGALPPVSCAVLRVE